MKRRRKNIKKNNRIIPILISVFIFLIVMIVVAALITKDEVYDELDDEGYYTETDDAFYKKILTNNTLDEFYNDMRSERNSIYQEVYVSKTSYDYIELKMIYNEGMTTTLTISSNLKSNEVNYTFELSYDDMYLLLDGNILDSFKCNVAVNNNVKKEYEKKYCSLIKEEIEDFLASKKELLNNSNLMNRIAGS